MIVYDVIVRHLTIYDHNTIYTYDRQRIVWRSYVRSKKQGGFLCVFFVSISLIFYKFALKKFSYISNQSALDEKLNNTKKKQTILTSLMAVMLSDSIYNLWQTNIS